MSRHLHPCPLSIHQHVTLSVLDSPLRRRSNTSVCVVAVVPSVCVVVVVSNVCVVVVAVVPSVCVVVVVSNVCVVAVVPSVCVVVVVSNVFVTQSLRSVISLLTSRVGKSLRGECKCVVNVQ